jgi:ATP-binding cassette subfamily C (CFTR/MRP) protein 3
MLFAALFSVIQRDSVDPGLVGLALSYALSVTSVRRWFLMPIADKGRH